MVAAILLLPATLFAEVNVPEGNNIDPIVISAMAANRWQQGAYEVWLLRGNCRLAQGDDVAVCQEAVIWIDHAAAATRERSKIIAYLEGDVGVRLVRDREPLEVHDQKWFGRFYTIHDVQVRAGVVAGKPTVLPRIYQRGMDRRNPEFPDALRQTGVEQTQYVPGPGEVIPPGQPSPAAGPLPPGAQPVPPGLRRIQVFPRGDVQMQAQWTQDPATGQAIGVINQGAHMIIEGLTAGKGNVPGLGSGPLTVDIFADRIVLWTVMPQRGQPGAQPAPDINSQFSQDQNQPMEVYMEGNVVFLQGDQTINANAMYYDVQNQVGTILAADVLTPAPGYEGKVRLHADIMQQIGKGHFRAQDAFVTSSRLGIPRYRLQMSEAEFEDIPTFDPLSGVPVIDPRTNKQARQDLLSAQNNFVYIEDVPIFYWPTIATDLNDPTFFLRRIQFKDDGVFGDQIYTDFAAYQLLGIKNKPVGTDWTVSLNYLSLRGFSEGTEFIYDRPDFLGIPGQATGKFNFWGIDDHGTDNLGQGRSSVQPEPDVPYRYRIFDEHRQELGGGFTFTAELGKISDRNFLQEYFRQDWDDLKDPTTDLFLSFRRENMAMDIFASARLDDFVTETQWLPRFDHYLLGQSIIADKLTWFEHTSLGYGEFKVATLPTFGPGGVSPSGDQDVSHLPWEPGNFSGARLVTRNEVDLPVELGPVKIVPYLLGEVGYWGQDINGQDLTQAYYQAGIRATLPMWAVDCGVESALWNVHGLAHKVEFQAEYLHAQSTQSMTQFPLYDPLDDRDIEDFRRRFVVNTFGEPAVPPPLVKGPPTKFDERYYALRNDMEGWVTAPSMEIADDLDELRLGLHQRWQTKRGPSDNPHIIDWIEFDTDVTIFPDANRDNFGTTVGLLDYNFLWHVGDRLTVLSDGIFDFFGQGQKIITTGLFLTRPPRGAFYVGFRILEGPISDEVLQMSYSYWMSPKWITTCGMSIDLKDTQNFGPTFSLVRVGESMLIGLNANYNPAQNSGGVALTIEPRFVPKGGKISQTPGIHVGQAGEFGVE